MWKYQISTGELTDPEGAFAGTGYSGLLGFYRNNPTMTNRKDKGPIPVGTYTIGPAHTDPERGPIVMALTPAPTDEMFGRDGFLIHGDNKTGNASEGCVILGPAIRQQIAASTDKTFSVIA